MAIIRYDHTQNLTTTPKISCAHQVNDIYIYVTVYTNTPSYIYIYLREGIYLYGRLRI